MELISEPAYRGWRRTADCQVRLLDAAGGVGAVMTVHQCPKCELRFTWITELEDHCRQDHPQFRHDYPVRKPAAAQHRQAGDTASAPRSPTRP